MQSNLLSDIALLEALLDWFFGTTAWAETTAPHAFATLLLATFKTDDLAQMAVFTKNYLENRRIGTAPGLTRDEPESAVAHSRGAGVEARSGSGS